MMTDNMEPYEKYGKTSLRDGYWWHFEDGENDITVNASAWSGKEYIYINDELMSEKLGLKFNGEHEFTYQGAAYRLEFKLLRMVTARMDCLIYKNGELIGQKAISFFDGTLKDGIKKTWPLFIVGFLAGTVGAAYSKSIATGEPFQLGLGTVVIATGLTLAYFMRKKS